MSVNCQYLSAQSPNTLMHLSRIGTSLKIPSRYKSGSYIRRHSRTATSTSSLLWRVMLRHHLHPLPALRMSGVLPPLLETCVDMCVQFYSSRVLKQSVCSWLLNGSPLVCETHQVFLPQTTVLPSGVRLSNFRYIR
jgi:hypothetical protein